AGVPGYEANNWNGIVVPRATPREVVEKLHSAITAALREPATAERITSAGLDVIADTPAEFARYLKSEAAKWGKVVKTAGIKAE
ncbi:MAG: tripartite tricarboxylate transporter substrate-binding protein, partial [Rhodospirillaceae bacterium]